jgi:hypothetical protein
VSPDEVEKLRASLRHCEANLEAHRRAAETVIRARDEEIERLRAALRASHPNGGVSLAIILCAMDGEDPRALIARDGDRPFLHAWQYYLDEAEGMLRG